MGAQTNVRCAPIVAKVENRATRKISRKLMFGLLRRCVAFQGHHGVPWSILDETMWSLTSPLAKRISGSKKFRLSPQKDFCNNIRQKRSSDGRTVGAAGSGPAIPVLIKNLILALGDSMAGLKSQRSPHK